jgi:hypothetical protein
VFLDTIHNYDGIQRCSCDMVPACNTTTVQGSLPPAPVELIAERFRVLGEPIRIRLLDAVLQGGLNR